MFDQVNSRKCACRVSDGSSTLGVTAACVAIRCLNAHVGSVWHASGVTDASAEAAVLKSLRSGHIRVLCPASAHRSQENGSRQRP
jgi:hypothetical protein